MAASITLNASQTFALVQRGKTTKARNQAANRLATGQRISSVTDSPQDYFQAKGLSERASALQATKSGIGQGIEALMASEAATKAVDSLGNQLKGLATAAQSADPTERAALAQQFDTVRQQLDSLVGDASYQGVNLLSNPAGTLTVTVGEQAGSTVSVAGVASDSTSLGVGTATTTYNNFANASDIDNAIAAVDKAMTSVRGTAATLGGNTGLLQIRERFASNLSNTLQDGAAKLTEADLNAESARLVASRARDGLAAQGQRIAARAEANVLQIVKGG